MNKQLLAEAGIILEALNMSIKGELCPEIKEAIAEIVPRIRLVIPDSPRIEVDKGRMEHLLSLTAMCPPSTTCNLNTTAKCNDCWKTWLTGERE